MDIKRIENIFSLVKQSSIKELCWEKDDIKIRIKKNLVLSSNFPEKQNDKDLNKNQEIETQKYLITSKSIGIFKNSNNDKDTVQIDLKVGDKVSKYQVMGYIEAMHISKEIISDYDGIIKEIFIKNGDKVEYGQKLFSIDK